VRWPATIALAGAAAVVLLLVSWRAVDRWYAAPRAALRGSVASARTALVAARADLAKKETVRRELDAFVARTLGGDVERVDHRLRVRLNRIVEEIGLAQPVVTTGKAVLLPSPAKRTFPRTAAWRALRDEVDCAEISASVSGEGDLAAAIEVIDRVRAEPWLKRIDRVELAPKGGGARFAVSVRLTTIFLPGREAPEQPVAAYDRTRLAPLAGLIAANPFRIPPAAPPAAAPPVEVATAPPAFPWDAWMLTGIADGPGGPEAWLRQRNSGETRRLTIGSEIGGAVLMEIESAGAVFRVGDETLRVAVGATLR
jgi:hypothetical protein